MEEIEIIIPIRFQKKLLKLSVASQEKFFMVIDAMTDCEGWQEDAYVFMLAWAVLAYNAKLDKKRNKNIKKHR